MAQSVLGKDPFSGAVFALRGKRGDPIKLLWWDGRGLELRAKRLERGRFTWPTTVTGVAVLTPPQLSMLLEGVGASICLSVKARFSSSQERFWKLRSAMDARWSVGGAVRVPRGRPC